MEDPADGVWRMSLLVPRKKVECAKERVVTVVESAGAVAFWSDNRGCKIRMGWKGMRAGGGREDGGRTGSP